MAKCSTASAHRSVPAIPAADGDAPEAGPLRLRVMHTPGHTHHHVCSCSPSRGHGACRLHRRPHALRSHGHRLDHHMCRAITCRTCGKTTWAGCGQHVDQLMRGVPDAQRCPGHTNDAAAPSTGFLGRFNPAVTTGRQAETKPGLRVARFVIGWSSWSSSSSPSERCGCSEAAAPCWRCRPWSTPLARPGPGGGHPAARRPHHRAGRAPAPDPCSADRLADRLAVRAPPGPRRPSPDTQDDWAGRGASVQSTRDEVGVRSGTNLDPREPPWRRPCGRRSRSPPPPSVSASA